MSGFRTITGKFHASRSARQSMFLILIDLATAFNKATHILMKSIPQYSSGLFPYFGLSYHICSMEYPKAQCWVLFRNEFHTTAMLMTLNSPPSGQISTCLPVLPKAKESCCTSMEISNLVISVDNCSCLHQIYNTDACLQSNKWNFKAFITCNTPPWTHCASRNKASLYWTQMVE